MPVYTVSPHPYRASTGSMPVPIIKTSNNRNARTGQYVEECSSCGSSYSDEHTIPLNTPYSTSPASGPGATRVSFSSEKRPVIVSAGHPTPTSLPPPGQVLRRYHNGALVYEPASSLPTRKERHGRRGSISSPHSNSYHHHHDEHRHRHGHASPGQWHNYQHEIDIRDEQQGVRGRTRIPRRLVNKDAVRESGLPWEEEEGSGAIIILRALSRSDIEKLVQRTESIRAHRREKHVRIIPEPTQTIRPHSDSRGEQSRRSEEKIARAEERAREAYEKAIKKEQRAEITGSYSDEIKARKARAEAEEKARQAEEVTIKERRKREDRGKTYHGTAVRVPKGAREVVIVR